MAWLFFLSAGIAGAVASAIAYFLFLRKSKERRGLFLVVSLVLFIVLLNVSTKTILPRLFEWQTDRQLREMPFYRDLAEVDPQTYQKVRVVASEAAKSGEGANTIASRIAPIVAGTVAKYVGAASDDSVIAFVNLSIHQVEELRRLHSDACYYYLYPQEKVATPVTSYLDQKGIDESIDVLGRLLHSATHTPQALPDVAKAGALLAPVQTRLTIEYGNDLMLFRQKPTDTAGREKVCAMTVSLLKNAEALPREDASLLLRYLLSDKGI